MFLFCYFEYGGNMNENTKRLQLSWRELSAVEVLWDATSPTFRPDCEVTATERLIFILGKDFFSENGVGDDHLRT